MRVSLNGNVDNFKKRYTSQHFTSEVIRTTGNVSFDTQNFIDSQIEGGVSHVSKVKPFSITNANKTYKLSSRKYVIKTPSSGTYQQKKDSVEQEAKRLSLIPNSMIAHCQKLIGTCETKNGEHYLIESLMSGNVPDGKDVKWSKKSLESALDDFYELDYANVYHGDPSKKNCLIDDDDNVNLIDFQYCENFKFDTDKDHKINAYRYKVPYFIAPSNAQMFEESNLSRYLAQIEPDEAKQLFRDYLSVKANYHTKRARMLINKNARPEIVEYESLMGQYLKNPPRRLVQLQAQKMELLLIHREISSALDDNGNIFAAIPSYIEGIKCARNLKMEAMIGVENTEKTDKKLAKLYRMICEDGDFWEGILKSELFGENGGIGVKNFAFNEIYKDKPSENQFKKSIKPYNQIPKLAQKLCPEFYSTTYNMPDEIVDEKFVKIKEAVESQSATTNSKVNAAYDAYKKHNHSESMYYSLTSLFDMVREKKYIQGLLQREDVSEDTKAKCCASLKDVSNAANYLTQNVLTMFDDTFKTLN